MQCVAIHNSKLPNNAFCSFLVIDCHESSLFNKSLDSRNDESGVIMDFACATCAHLRLRAKSLLRSCGLVPRGFFKSACNDEKYPPPNPLRKGGGMYRLLRFCNF
ncbi:hypothetical protein [Helicobacter sp. T3_23-1056]